MSFGMKNNNPEKTRQRIRISEVLCGLFPFVFVALFAPKYLIMPAINEDYETTRNTIIYDEISSYYTEGDIVDRNGNVIISNSYAESPLNYSYAYLLGYYTVSSGLENTYGLRGNLKDYTVFTLDENNKGLTVTLTTDNDLQNYAYTLLNGQEGSITVIDADTGAILALTSQSTIDYDVNDTASFTTSTVADAQYRRGTYENDPPGSTFKIITAVAALTKAEEEGLSADFFSYYDTGSYTAEGDTWTISNYNNQVYGECDLNTAMAHSINCYFANLGVETGAEYLTETAEAFLIGETITIPYLCTLYSSFSLSDCAASIAQTSFGQGDTEITPVHLAVIAQSVANDGVMLQPYIVSSIAGKYTARTKELSATTSSSVNASLKEAMHEAALEYGFDEGTYGMVYAKTGSAECADGRTHCYMIGFTDEYAFCISFNDMSISSDLYDEALNLVNYLNSMS